PEIIRERRVAHADSSPGPEALRERRLRRRGEGRETRGRLAVALHDEDLAPIADLPQDIAQVARQLGRADGALHGRIIQDSVLYATTGPATTPGTAGWR